MEKLDQSVHKEAKNTDGKTPWQLFKDEHKEMLEQATKRTKEKSRSSIIVATVILTATFAVALAVTGGNDQNEEISGIFFRLFLFMVIEAFFCSIASVIMFFNVPTASYEFEDFLQRSILKRLTRGVMYLSMAIVSTCSAFLFSLVLQSNTSNNTTGIVDVANLICFGCFLLNISYTLFGIVKLITCGHRSPIYCPQNLL